MAAINRFTLFRAKNGVYCENHAQYTRPLTHTHTHTHCAVEERQELHVAKGGACAYCDITAARVVHRFKTSRRDEDPEAAEAG
jgi:hypothetical protein